MGDANRKKAEPVRSIPGPVKTCGGRAPPPKKIFVPSHSDPVGQRHADLGIQGFRPGLLSAYLRLTKRWPRGFASLGCLDWEAGSGEGCRL